MRMYRTGWLTAGIALLVVGVGAAAHASTRAFPTAFVVVVVTCLLVGLCAVGIRGSARPRRVRARFVATSALVGGTIAVAVVGFAALLGPRVGLLALVVLVTSPSAVRAYGRWLRLVPTPSASLLDALARIFGYASREEILAQDAWSLYFDVAERETLLAQLRMQRAITNHELRLKRRDGSAVWVLENMTMLEGSEHGIIEGTTS